MIRYRLLLVLFYLCLALMINAELRAQQMTIDLVEDTILYATVHPFDPTIFHFQTFNSGEETILVDIIKSNADHPEGWDISICTVACLPPENDEAVFPIGGMLEEEVTLYFFPRSPGLGSVDVFMQSQEDSTETYSVRLYVQAELPTDLESTTPSIEYLRIGDELFFDIETECELHIHDILGHQIAQQRLAPGRQTINLSSYTSGVYTITILRKGADITSWKVYKG